MEKYYKNLKIHEHISPSDTMDFSELSSLQPTRSDIDLSNFISK